MRNLVPALTGFDALPNLPEHARTQSGVQFDPRTERWSYRDNLDTVSLNFTHFQLVTDSFMVASKLTLLWYAENMSQGTLVHLFHRLEHFLRAWAVDSQTITHCGHCQGRRCSDHGSRTWPIHRHRGSVYPSWVG